jgi:long-chain acyl-CoA synthetase
MLGKERPADCFIQTRKYTASDGVLTRSDLSRPYRAFKRPKEYIFIEALPKNNYGKILKTELRNRQD